MPYCFVPNHITGSHGSLAKANLQNKLLHVDVTRQKQCMAMHMQPMGNQEVLFEMQKVTKIVS